MRRLTLLILLILVLYLMTELGLWPTFIEWLKQFLVEQLVPKN